MSVAIPKKKHEIYYTLSMNKWNIVKIYKLQTLKARFESTQMKENESLKIICEINSYSQLKLYVSEPTSKSKVARKTCNTIVE